MNQGARAEQLSLVARDVVHSFGAVVALAGASVEVSAGRTLALVGESGSGKTTLLRCFNRLIDPNSGVVSIGGIDVAAQDVVQLRRRIGYVPQDGGLLPHWRVLRNVALVPELRKMPESLAAAAAALEIVGMPARTFGARFPHELSGGQRQRVALARAIAAGPGVILLDEPFGALDAITRAELHRVFEDARREVPVTMLLVTHDLAEAARLGDEVAVMRRGRVEQRGSIAQLRASPSTEYVATLIERSLAASSAITAK